MAAQGFRGLSDNGDTVFVSFRYLSLDDIAVLGMESYTMTIEIPYVEFFS